MFNHCPANALLTQPSRDSVDRGWMKVCLLLLSLCMGCKPNASAKPGANAPKEVAIVRGETMVVSPTTWPRLVRVQGSLIADESTLVGSKVAGRVQQIHVDLGDMVDQDAPMVTIEPEQFELLVAQAEAQLTQARSAVGLREGELVEKLNPENAAPVREVKAILDEATKSVRRLRLLAGQNTVSATDLEVAEAAERVAAARLTSAQNSVREKLALIRVQTAQLQLAKQNLVDTVIRAPFRGMIQNRTVSSGTYVQAGQSVLMIVKNSVLRFRAAVPERFSHDLELGQKVRIKLELSGQEREVEITRISPTLDPMNRSLTFEAIVENEDLSLRSGLFAEAEVILEPESKAIAIPMKSMIRFAGVDKVWKIENKMVKEQIIRLGRAESGMQEIVLGLQAGDVIMQDATQGRVGRLEPGTPEEIK